MSRENVEIVRRQNEAWNRRDLTTWLASFHSVRVEMHGITEVGSEVVVQNTALVRGRDAIEVVARSTFVFTVENGQITRQRMFQEHADALEAAGLSEL